MKKQFIITEVKRLNSTCPFCHSQMNKDTTLLRIYKCGTVGGWYEGLYDAKCSKGVNDAQSQ